ncbi:MAG: hypothetical protein JOY84_18385 [Curvibacter sp.]|nr:hypothetical protein [Curvibacter sp.]
MALTIDAEYLLAPLQALVNRPSAWVKRVHPLSDGSAVLHLTSLERYDMREHLVVLRDGHCQVINEPPSLTQARLVCAEDPAREDQGLVQSFQIGDRIGLLLSDRWLWLFDPLQDDTPIEIAIDTPLPIWAPESWPDSVAAHRVARCGTTCDHRVPVVLGHPAATHDYTAHWALLDVDVESRRACWTQLGKQGQTQTIRYGLNSNFEGVEGHEGTYLCDLSWMGDRLRAFSIGNRTHIGRMGMAYAAALEADAQGQGPVLVHPLDEGCHGAFIDSGHVLLTPASKSGARKGKPALLDLASGTEIELTLRGHAGFRPFAARAGKVWLVGGGATGAWCGWQQISLHDGEGKPGRIVVCSID